MSELTPTARTPAPVTPVHGRDNLFLADESLQPKWRVFSDRQRPGTSSRSQDGLTWSVSPGESTVIGSRPPGEDVVDLTHVRAMFRLSGDDARRILAKLCGLDLSDEMFPDGAAARTLVAGVATEIVRDDQGAVPSYLILPSRSFGRYMWETIVDAGAEFGLDGDSAE